MWIRHARTATTSCYGIFHHHAFSVSSTSTLPKTPPSRQFKTHIFPRSIVQARNRITSPSRGQACAAFEGQGRRLYGQIQARVPTLLSIGTRSSQAKVLGTSVCRFCYIKRLHGRFQVRKQRQYVNRFSVYSTVSTDCDSKHNLF